MKVEKNTTSVDMRQYLNYSNVKGSIIYRLINAERNLELLEDIPHIKFLDLSIVFHCLISQEKHALASLLVHNAHLKLWGVSQEMLYQAAKENTPKLMPYEIRDMVDVMCDIIRKENPEEYNHDDCVAEFADGVPMYMLSNKSQIEGAACMLYPNLLRDFAEEIGSSFYVIPSSIHEVLLLPSENLDRNSEMKNMIKEINYTQVKPEEILSYSLYFYDREEGKICRC